MGNYCCLKNKLFNYLHGEDLSTDLQFCRFCTHNNNDLQQMTQKYFFSQQQLLLLSSHISDPEWSNWSVWGDCSVTCGLGSKGRTRACLDSANGGDPLPNEGGLQCPGPDSHDDDCDPGACAVDGGWTEWQGWGECSVG